MSGRPIWYELMTPEPGAVAAFYRATLGWEIPDAGMEMPNGSNYRMIARTDGGSAGGVLKITPQMAEHGVRPAWFPYFHVGDVDAAVEQATGMGGQVFMPPWTSEGIGRMAMLADPQGASFYLMDPTPPPDRPDAQSDLFQANTPGHCWWNELQTSDEAASTAFYTALLGWSADNAMPMGEHGNYRFVECEGEAIGAINPWLGEWLPVSWLPYFGVADIDAARTAAEANGGTIRGEIHQVPGGDYIFTASDPAGAPVGFVGKKGA